MGGAPPRWSSRQIIAGVAMPGAARLKGSGMRAALSGITPRGRALLAAGHRVGLRVSSASRTCCGSAAAGRAAAARGGVRRAAAASYRLGLVRSVSRAAVAGRGQQPRVAAAAGRTLARLPTGPCCWRTSCPTRWAPGRASWSTDGSARWAPARWPTRSAPTSRGRFPVGPMTVRLTDPFGLVRADPGLPRHRRHLVVTPRSAAAPRSALSGEPGPAPATAGPARSRAAAARTTPPSASTDAATTCAGCTGARPPAPAS